MAGLTPGPVKSALRTLDVIEFVIARGSAQAQEIAAALDIPVSSLSYLLATLCGRGYLERAGRLYAPGPSLDRLRRPTSALTIEERLEPTVLALRRELNETVSLMVREGWDAVVLLTAASDQALRYAIDPGEHRPLHALASGKVLLANLEPPELDRYFAEVQRARFTERTLVGERELRSNLEEVRRAGFAEAHEESTPGICSLARPALLDGEVVGAIGVAIPTVRFTMATKQRALAALARH